jgi:hypothetical protein
MSAQDDIKQFIKELARLKKKAEDELLDIGKEAVKLIKKRTRLGYGVDSHGAKKTKLKALSTPYKATRKKHKPQGPSTASKSNLTYTGEMLDDLEAVRKSDNSIKIDLKTTHSKDKAEWVSEDRPFNNLSKAEIKQLRQQLQKAINKEADKV